MRFLDEFEWHPFLVRRNCNLRLDDSFSVDITSPFLHVYQGQSVSLCYGHVAGNCDRVRDGVQVRFVEILSLQLFVLDLTTYNVVYPFKIFCF